jgi:hypothetical protein
VIRIFTSIALFILGSSVVLAQDPNAEVRSTANDRATTGAVATFTLTPLNLKVVQAVDDKNLAPKICLTFNIGAYEEQQKTALTPSAKFEVAKVALVPFVDGPQVLTAVNEKFAKQPDYILEKNAGGISGNYAIYPNEDLTSQLKSGSKWVLAVTNADGSLILVQGFGQNLEPYSIPQLSQAIGFKPQQVEGIKVDDPTSASGEKTERGWRSGFNMGSNLPSSGRASRSFVLDGLLSQFNGDRQSFIRANYRVESPMIPVQRSGQLIGTASLSAPVLLAQNQFVPKFFYQVSHLSNQSLTQNQMMGEAGVAFQPLKLGGPLDPLTLVSSLQLPYFHQGFRKLDTFSAGSQRLSLALSTGATVKVGGANARFEVASRRWFMFRNPGAGFYKNPSQLEFSFLMPTQFGSLPTGAARQYIQISYFTGQTEQRQFGPTSNVAGSFAINLVSF